jgi:hypothetical protein
MNISTNEKKQWKGLAALVADAVSHGATAVERVHLAIARRPFDVLEQVPVVAAPAYVARLIHDASVGATYATVRGVTRVVGRAVDVALDVASSEGGRRTEAEVGAALDGEAISSVAAREDMAAAREDTAAA